MVEAIHTTASQREGLAFVASILVDEALVAIARTAIVVKNTATSSYSGCYGPGYVDIHCCDQECTSRAFRLLGSKLDNKSERDGSPRTSGEDRLPLTDHQPSLLRQS